MDSRPEIVLLNPLGAALKHYTASLERLLVDCGATVRTVTLMEPSAPGQGRRRWVGEYVKTLRGENRRRSHNNPPVVVVQTWPMLGYWDYVMSKLILWRTPVFIVMHDPHPLVHARGYGRLARWMASRSLIAASAVVHSKAASDVVHETTSIRNVVDLPHPMFPPEKSDGRSDGRIVIRVLGQYKADRNLECMEQLAIQGSPQWSYEVVGRGWPPIAGWKITSGFVSEGEFDAYLRNSSVIVIPYLRFFQSGVAIRGLEVGTPIVGLRSSSLADLLGRESRWLVDEDSWIKGVKAAIHSDSQTTYSTALNAYNNVFEQWQAWLDSEDASEEE